MNWKAFFAVLAGVPVILLLAYGLTRDPSFTPSTLAGSPAPDFALQTLKGDTLRLSSLRGQVVVINFWATWCDPCREEHPVLVDASNRYRGHGVSLIGIVYQDTKRNAEQWYRERGGDWVNVMDPGSRTAIDFGVRGVPETFFIGRDGRIAYRYIRPIWPDTLEHWVQKLLSDSAAAPKTN